MPTSKRTMTDIAGEIRAGLQANRHYVDIDGVYGDQVVIWHAHDDTETTIETPQLMTGARRALEGINKTLPDLHNEDVRVVVADDSTVLATFRQTGTLPDGVAWANPMCLLYRVEGGLLVRVDEYFHHGHVERLSEYNGHS